MIDDTIKLLLFIGGFIVLLCFIDWLLSVTIWKPEQLPHGHEPYTPCRPKWESDYQVRIVQRPPYDWEDEGRALPF